MSEHQSARSSLAREESDAAQAIEVVSRSLLDYQANKFSLANAEKVVKPPQKPVANKRV